MEAATEKLSFVRLQDTGLTRFLKNCCSLCCQKYTSQAPAQMRRSDQKLVYECLSCIPRGEYAECKCYNPQNDQKQG